MYEDGEGVEQDLEEAVKWYRASAEQNAGAGQWRLGTMYHLGEGVEKDLAEAVNWYRKSAENGNSEGQWRLGHMYQFGEGVEQDYAEAVKWYRKSAENGNGTAQWRLGDLYSDGLGVEKNPQEAVNWVRKSAENDNGTAQCIMGNLYHDGYEDVILPCPEKAVEWWKKAVENEFPEEEAACRLGYAYYDGDGVEQNIQEAKRWFQVAVDNGYSCEAMLDIIRSELKERDNNQMQQYADLIIRKKISISKLYKRVSKDLRKDFGSTWELLQLRSQKFLITGVMCYILLYSTGVYGNIDFSSAITPMFKALELELGKYLYSGYVQYLRENEVPFREFVGRRVFIKKISEYEPAYRDPEDLSEFTLGTLQYLFGAERRSSGGAYETNSEDKRRYKTRSGTYIKTVDATMLQYLKTIVKEDAFVGINADREMTDYLFYLSETVATLADRFRNPAAHKNVMSHAHAEECGNYLIKVEKLLGKFLEKLNIEPQK